MTSIKTTLALLTCAAAGLLSLQGQAAPPPAQVVTQPAPSPQGQPQGPQHNNGPMPGFMHHRGGPMMMPPHQGFCHGGELFCASVLSDNPGETLQKLNGILPAPSNGTHYQVRVSVEQVPDHKDHPGMRNQPGEGTPPPAPSAQ